MLETSTKKITAKTVLSHTGIGLGVVLLDIAAAAIKPHPMAIQKAQSRYSGAS
jgi:hypothetical protein